MFIVFEDFITSFFYHVLAMSIVATVIGFVIVSLRNVVRNKISPSCNYMIWLIFIFALIFPISIPSKVSVYNYIDLNFDSSIKTEKDKAILEFSDCEMNKSLFLENVKNSSYKLFFNQYIKRVIVYSWLAIAVFRISIIVDNRRILARNVGNIEIDDDRIKRILERCKKKLKIKKNIKVIKQNYIKEASTFGIFNVRILLTKELLVLDDLAISDIFMHELAHYKRKDNVMNMAILLVKAIHWFNPLLEDMFSQMKVDLEYATDELAVNGLSEVQRKEYCKTIIRVSNIQNGNLENILGLSSNAKSLLDRVQKISSKEKFEKHFRIVSISTILVMIIICMVLYPTSYGNSIIPKLYLKLENGTNIEVKDFDNLETIELPGNAEVKLLIEDKRNVNYLLCHKINLKNDTSTIEKVAGDNLDIENGEIIYKFTVFYGEDRSIDYGIKIVAK